LQSISESIEGIIPEKAAEWQPSTFRPDARASFAFTLPPIASTTACFPFHSVAASKNQATYSTILGCPYDFDESGKLIEVHFVSGKKAGDSPTSNEIARAPLSLL
jgi:hypothetical protein